MLTRRHIRTKVMQSVYAISNGNTNTLEEEIKFLKKSFNGVFDLYLVNLALLKAIWYYAKEQSEIHGTLINKREEEEKEHQAIYENKFLSFLVNHQLLGESIKLRKIKNWENEFDYVKKIYVKILESDFFRKYCKEKNKGERQQRDFIIYLFKKIIAPEDLLYNYYEDLNLTWIDDIPLVNTFLLKQLNKIKLGESKSLELSDTNKQLEDIKFGIELFGIVIGKDEELQKELEGKTPNWDAGRIANLDAILIKIAIAELLHFPSIPTKVTLNEYLEVAKEYSTPKSSQFINGVLDNLVKKYEKTNRLNKIGRGLL